MKISKPPTDPAPHLRAGKPADVQRLIDQERAFVDQLTRRAEQLCPSMVPGARK